MRFTRFIASDQFHIRDDGRTVEGRIVPYGEVADVVEQDRVTGEVKRYQEQFLPGSCMRMVQGIQKRGNASFIAFLLDHNEESLDHQIGHATDLRSEEDGAYATFRLYESRDLQKVQSMLRESHTGLSVNFGDLRPPRLINDVVSRVQVVIDHVAATPIPVYSGAGITAMRAEEVIFDGGGFPELSKVKQYLAEIKDGSNE